MRHAPKPIWFSDLLGLAPEHVLMGLAHEHMLMGLAHKDMLMGLAHEHLLMGPDPTPNYLKSGSEQCIRTSEFEAAHLKFLKIVQS